MAQHPQQGFLLPPPQQAPAAGGRGQGGGNRRRRGGGRGQRADANVAPLRQTNLPVPTGAPPRPTHLATTSTPERNDPLWTSGVAGAELQPMPNVEYVYSSAEALMDVTSVIHSDYSTASSGYAHRVPESALAYYCATLVWSRMLSLHISNGLPFAEAEARFVEQVASLQLEAPLLLAYYLSGFGNTRVPSGRDIRFRMIDRAYLSSNGFGCWFGQVSPETQSLYQNYPCLAVFFSRMLASLDSSTQRWWSLPDSISPGIPGAIRPSLALLGYGPRENLSPQQVGFLASSQIYPDEPIISSNTSFPLNISLLMAVHRELKAVGSLKLSPVPTGILGSQAQLGRITLEGEARVPLVEHPATFESPYAMPPEVSFAASAFGYRIYHAVDELGTDSVAPWCVWIYQPSSASLWLDFAVVGNQLRDSEPQLLQISEFRTTPYLMRARLEALEQALNRVS